MVDTFLLLVLKPIGKRKHNLIVNTNTYFVLSANRQRRKEYKDNNQNQTLNNEQTDKQNEHRINNSTNKQ